METAFISWTRFDVRCEHIGRQLGASVHYIYSNHKGPLRVALVRYVTQSMRTWQLLWRERPRVLMVQNPPIFLVLIAWVYSRLFGARFVVDSHTAAFLSPKWRWALPLHAFLSRRALTTVVTNEHLRKTVSDWGAPASVLAFTAEEDPTAEPVALAGDFKVAVVSTGAEDEPLAAVFAAASHVPEVTFYVTGDVKRIPPAVLAGRPANCVMTGYVPKARYLSLLASCDVVMDLTTRDHTLLMGAFEAVSLGKPLIVSDWPVLRGFFSEGTLYVDNTPEGIAHGVRQARDEAATLSAGVLALRGRLLADYQAQLQQLRRLIAGKSPATGAARAEPTRAR
jgi:glycosyltransferase involved in cell wall biosynthesis